MGLTKESKKKYTERFVRIHGVPSAGIFLWLLALQSPAVWCMVGILSGLVFIKFFGESML